MGVVRMYQYGCCCKEIYRFPHITYPYSTCRAVATRFEVVQLDNTRSVLLLCVTGTILNFADFFIAALIRP